MNDLKFKVEELIATLLTLIRQVEGGHLEGEKSMKYCRSIMKACPPNLVSRAKHLGLTVVDSKYEKGTTGTLERLNRDVKKAVSNYERAVCGLDKYLKESLWLESLQRSKEMGFKNSELKFWGSTVWGVRFVFWVWYAYLQQSVYFILGLIFAIMSFMIVVGEMTIFWHQGAGRKDNLVKTFFFNTGVLSVNIAILFPLSYICICTFYGLFKIKILGLYNLNAG